MKTIIIHNRHEEDRYTGIMPKSAGTVILEVPTSQMLLKAMVDYFTTLEIQTVPILIGGSFLHPKDQLNKKLGRKLATERIKCIQFTLEVGGYQNMNDAVYLHLRGVDDSQQVHYGITVKIYRDSRALRVVGVTTRSWN